MGELWSENLLHVAVKANDLESVLFVLGTHTDPTRSTNDTTRRTALHISATVDDEMILRNLVLKLSPLIFLLWFFILLYISLQIINSYVGRCYIIIWEYFFLVGFLNYGSKSRILYGL
uniref:ANK_REP_REGION domain-containing protein n=1 Tax=Heterorhabditis bacteriophora TaxID=37862 RepID=A0A1I7W7K7_HETBA